MTSPTNDKKALRAVCLARRLAISSEERQAANKAISHTVSGLSAFLDADLILAFSPVRGEVDLMPLYEIALARKIPLAFPRCTGKEMTFHVVRSMDELTPDRFGIPAPCADAPLATATEHTLCLMPGLAAGRDGTRLGYGGGFYDRFLTTFRGITLFPIYESLLFVTLPTEETDMRVTYLVTEKGVISPNG